MSEITYSINEEKKNKYDLLTLSHMSDTLLDALEILSSSGISIGPGRHQNPCPFCLGVFPTVGTCFACHWSSHWPGWSQVGGPRGGQRGRNGSTHLQSHWGPIRKLTSIWFGEEGAFSCLFMLTMKVTLIYNSVGWSREGRLLWVEKIN